MPDLEQGKVVCIELDSVLADYAEWIGPEQIGLPRVGAVEFVRALRDAGWDVVVVTTREPEVARGWLEQQGFTETHAQREVPPARVVLSGRGMRFEWSFHNLVERIERS